MRFCCPSCGSNDIQIQSQGDMLHCQKCGCSFPKIRVFFSYKHDRYTRLILRIKRSLESIGFSVWFDNDRISAGTPSWRSSICEGIKNSDMVFAFLSKPYIQDSVVCRDELSIAVCTKRNVIRTILLENPAEIGSIPVIISDPQWNDLSTWVKYEMSRGETPIDQDLEEQWEHFYTRCIDQLADQLCSPEIQKFSGEINVLKESLSPYLSEAKLTRYTGDYLGRVWLDKKCESWRSREDSRALIVYGPPGVGKSTFAAHYIHMNPYLASAFFCEWNNQRICTASCIIRTIAYHMALTFPEYRQALVDTCIANKSILDLATTDSQSVNALFSILISDTFAKCVFSDREERYVVLIDAINELATSEITKLAHAIHDNLQFIPQWLCFLFTSQNTQEVTQEFQFLGQYQISASSKENIEDIRCYIQHKLKEDICRQSSREQLIDQICDYSEGIFLYATMVVEAINNGLYQVSNQRDAIRDALPANLNYAIRGYVMRMFPDMDEFRKNYRDIISLICASKEPLPLCHIREIVSLKRSELKDLIERFGLFVSVREINDLETITLTYQSYYLWFMDRNASGKYSCSVEDGVEMLSDLFMGYYSNHRYEEMTTYLLSNFLFILENAGRYGLKTLKTVVNDELFIDFAAKVLFEGGHVIESNQMLIHLIEIASRLLGSHMREVIAAARKRLALNYINQGILKLARQVLIECEETDLPFIQDRNDLYVSVLANIAWISKELNDLETADTYIAEAMQRIEMMPDSVESMHSKADAYYIQGTILYKQMQRLQDDPESMNALVHKCEKTLDKAISIWNELGNRDSKHCITMANMTRAWLYMRKGEYRHALMLFQETLTVREELFSSNPNSTYIAKSLSNIAEASLQIATTEDDFQNLEYGQKCCDRAIKIYEQSNSTQQKDYNLARVLCTKAKIHELKGETDVTLKSYINAISIYLAYGKAFSKNVDQLRAKIEKIESSK